ncbi:hypothetical protein L602_004000000240 [Cupriavidus gilardii J11]|uniref:Uncharacterized protein n=1 Tax=Cupriavidus gilardii J11 TaxID=936133 RepID=A0A562B8F1_9BURK|nr:hypothetical protein [Cupriavidus gilardii]TWG81486.1 hypothetical protein L602_004000000240 [Cupriavidus gilardii J11]
MKRKPSSLRALAEKWLPLSGGNPPRVTRFGHTAASRVPYVCVAVPRADALLSIFFFRHRDGKWYVFPPLQ